MSTAVPIEDARRPLSREARIGVGTVGVVLVLRVILGSSVINDWEGWATFLSFLVAALVEGLVLGILAFGLIVRLAVRSHVSRAAVSSLGAGVLAVLSLAIPYSAPQAILGGAAVAIGLVARERAERSWTKFTARLGIGLGLVTILGWLTLVSITVATGDWPHVP